MRLVRDHLLVLKILELQPLSSIDHVMGYFRGPGPALRARLFAVLDQLETLQMATTTRTATREGDLWSSTARGRARAEEIA